MVNIDSTLHDHSGINFAYTSLLCGLKVTHMMWDHLKVPNNQLRMKKLELASFWEQEALQSGELVDLVWSCSWRGTLALRGSIYSNQEERSDSASYQWCSHRHNDEDLKC
jgi:hypothetical protein